MKSGGSLLRACKQLRNKHFIFWNVADRTYDCTGYIPALRIRNVHEQITFQTNKGTSAKNLVIHTFS